ncbi:MAG: glycoside hydrolase family 3 protein, partial [Rhodobacteraceae bacterium]|nr:glycoside hydrolase family 3 protein [Paracoccaceae bacterium]
EWMPPLDHVARAGDNAPRAMYLRYRLIADELRQLGIDADCAPMVDIAGFNTHAFLRNRCYADTVDKVIACGRAVADGLLAGGVLPVVKHMPGHGRAILDSHVDLPRIDAPLAELLDTDFVPFRALNDLPMGMTGHLVYDRVDRRAATVSPTIMSIIRDRIGFNGLIMTDAITMKALDGSLTEIAIAALAAGCDVVLLCNANLADRIAVAEAAGKMTDAAGARALAALRWRTDPDGFDIAAAEAELSVLMGGQVYG